jgi:hemoglobin-like flavoprotein
MMPVFYIDNAEVSDEEIAMAKNTWNLVVDDKSAQFKLEKQNPEFEQSSCISWFYTIFYDRLFNVHPMCRPLFTSGIVSQGKFLVKMMSLTLNCIANKNKFTKSMEDLALRHCERGVRGVEFGIVGDVLFYSLRKVVGEDAYSREVELAWVKIYSSMLGIIVPLVVEYERTGVVHRTAERETGSGGELIDSAHAAVVEADKASVDRENAKSAEREAEAKAVIAAEAAEEARMEAAMLA